MPHFQSYRGVICTQMYRAREPLSISIDWLEIGNDQCERTFVVNARERDALAGSFGLLELSKLVVEVEVRRGGPDNPIFNLEGILQASVVQECVLCLGFVTTNIREDLSAKFIPEARIRMKKDVFNHTDPDHPEIYSGSLLEIGKLVQDQLSLAIEPYPRHDQFGEGKRCGLKRHVENEPMRPNHRPFANLDNLLNMGEKDENS